VVGRHLDAVGGFPLRADMRALAFLLAPSASIGREFGEAEVC
jgi:hypothetical protein